MIVSQIGDIICSSKYSIPCYPRIRSSVEIFQEISSASSLAQEPSQRCEFGDRVPLGQAFCEARRSWDEAGWSGWSGSSSPRIYMDFYQTFWPEIYQNILFQAHFLWFFWVGFRNDRDLCNTWYEALCFGVTRCSKSELLVDPNPWQCRTSAWSSAKGPMPGPSQARLQDVFLCPDVPQKPRPSTIINFQP